MKKHNENYETTKKYAYNGSKLEGKESISTGVFLFEKFEHDVEERSSQLSVELLELIFPLCVVFHLYIFYI